MSLLEDFKKFLGLEQVLEQDPVRTPEPEPMKKLKPEPAEVDEPEPSGSEFKNEQGVFTAVPKYDRKRIFGTEQEFGVKEIKRKYPGWLQLRECRRWRHL